MTLECGEAEKSVRTCAARLIIVGNSGGTNVGMSLAKGAEQMGFCLHFCDSYEAFGSCKWLTRLNWRLLGHRPTFLGAFSSQVLQACRQYAPSWLLTTGLSPVDAHTLEVIGTMGIQRLNYLTDDPWNPAHRARWFFKALPFYDRVFTVRRANLEDLITHGCRSVEYLPFGFDSELFYQHPGKEYFEHELMFAGGADRDRLPFITSLIRAGFKIALYGDYWDRFAETTVFAHGHATPEELRNATKRSKISLCLVRQANRDRHVMRSFEIPAMGGCMLTEDTEEHREIFGPEGEAVVYFGSIPEMIEKARWLLNHEDERRRLATAAHRRIINGHNTYQDRLTAMLT